MRRGWFGIAVAITLLLTVAGPAAAAPPTIERYPVDSGWFVDEFLTSVCGFEVLVREEGHIAFRTWTDAEGNPTRIVFTINVHGSMTAGGATLRFVDAGMDTITFLDGGGEHIAIHGNLGLIVVPGEGPVLGAAGRFEFMLTPVLDEEGNPVLDEEGNAILEFTELASSGKRAENFEALCEALAPE